MSNILMVSFYFCLISSQTILVVQYLARMKELVHQAQQAAILAHVLLGLLDLIVPQKQIVSKIAARTSMVHTFCVCVKLLTQFTKILLPHKVKMQYLQI